MLTVELGRTKFARLYLIGTCSTHLSVEALKMAVAEAKAGKDVRCYERAVEALKRVAPAESEAVLDSAWVDQTSRAVKSDTGRLEHELKGYKNNLIKESIRVSAFVHSLYDWEEPTPDYNILSLQMGNEDLGRHYHQIGDLASASKAFGRMRDFCTTTSHISSMLLKNITVAADRSDWLGVQANVHRLKNLRFTAEDEAKYTAKTVSALALSQLATGAFRDAATSFTLTEPGLADTFNEVISPNDIAVYGGLCALASMDRTELSTHVLDNKSFRTYLELEPHIRRAISFFCASKFRSCLDILDAYEADYLLDLHLQQHVSALYTRIRTKAMQQYIIPYSKVSLDGMATIFSPRLSIRHENSGLIDINCSFVSELIDLIQNDTLDAQLDVEKGLLVTRQTDARTEVHLAALETVRAYLDNAHAQLLRVNVLHAGLEVPGGEDEYANMDPELMPAAKRGYASKIAKTFKS